MMTGLHSRLFTRTLLRNADVNFLKLVTLAVGFSCGILVLIFSIHEFQYDTKYKDSDQLFRILARNTDKEYFGNRLSSLIPEGIVNTINNKFGNSMTTSRVKALNAVTVIDPSNQPFYDQKIYAADSTIESIFSFNVVEGNINDFADSHDLVAIASRRAASRYFGNEPVVGKTVKLTTFGDTLNVVIVAVFEDFPSNTHESFEFFMRYDSSAIRVLNFDADQSALYVQLKSEKDTPGLLAGIGKGHTEYLLQPLTEIYFGPRVTFEEAHHGDLYSMIILICITSLILLLAICSFVNLSTITLPYRSKEIAVKKFAGTSPLQLLLQFVYESFVLAGAALLLSVMMILGANNYISRMLDMDIVQMLQNSNFAFWGSIVLMVFGTAISPVFLVIRFIRATPMRLLRVDTITFPGFKRIITIVQFGVSIFLIVSSILVGRQIEYSLIKEPGRNHEQIVYIACPANIHDSAIYNIKGGWPDKNPSVIDAMALSQLPNHLTGKEPGSDLFVLEADYNFKDFFQFTMLEGEWFQYTDRDSVIVVNRSALKKMSNVDRNVIGVIQDFGAVFNQPERPVKIRLAQNVSHNWICFRLDEVDIRNTVEWIERRMRAKGSYGKANFLNGQFEIWLTYQDRLNGLSYILTIISLLLAACAIYGVTVSLVRDKMKEIAIHHLLGARTTDVTRLLAIGLLRQMLVALVFFGPTTYIFLNEMLKTFAYATKFFWTDSVYPVGYCLVVIIGLSVYQAFYLNRSDFSAVLKGSS